MGQNKSFELRSLRLDQHSQTPFYRQVYERIRDAIAAGILRPTERLPLDRSLRASWPRLVAPSIWLTACFPPKGTF